MYDLENNYTYHAPNENQRRKYVILRAQAKELAAIILDGCPDSRERSIALTKVEESIMWANAAIARSEE